MKNLKQIIKTNKIKSIVIFLIIFTIFHWAITLANQNRLINEAKIKINQLEKPSKIEIQKQELDILEKSWKEKESKLNNAKEIIRIIEQEKPDLENQIRTKRNEILWITKK